MSKAHLIKFRCAHCGGRIAVPDRNLDRLVTCPECGRTTHPLAEQILAEQGAAVGETTATPEAPEADTEAAAGLHAAQSGAGPRTAAVETSPPPAPAEAPLAQCANCGRTLGRLEKPVYWNGSVICAACHRILSDQEFSARAPAVAGRPWRSSLALWIGVAVAVALLLLLVVRVLLGGLLTSVLIAAVLFGGVYLLWKGRSAVRRRLDDLKGPAPDNEAGWNARLRRWVRSGNRGKVAMATGVILTSTAASGLYHTVASRFGRRAGDRTGGGGGGAAAHGTPNPPAGA